MTPGDLNPQITNSRVVVLAGAGASASLRKWTMPEFLNNLRDRIQSGSEEEVALEFLHKLRPQSNNDLEELIDGVNDMLVFHRVVDSSDLLDFDEVARLAEASGALRDLIYSMILEQYAEVDPEEAVRLHGPLWATLSAFDSSPNFIPVFTTNYDWGFETYAARASLPVLDGFKQRGLVDVWDRGNYGRRLGRRPRQSRDMALFKLHGSTSWYLKDGRIEKYPMSRNLPGLKNMLIYPGRTKQESLDEPYQTSYQYFAACLRKAEKLVVIGYKFGDLSIHRVMESALAEGAAFSAIIMNGPNFSWDDVREPRMLADHSVIVPEYYRPQGGDTGLPFYLTRLRGHLGLGPLLSFIDENDPTTEFGSRDWLHLTLRSSRNGRIRSIGVLDKAGQPASIEAGKPSKHVVLLQTKNRTMFGDGLRFRQGVTHFYFGLAEDNDIKPERAFVFVDGQPTRVSVRVDVTGAA